MSDYERHYLQICLGPGYLSRVDAFANYAHGQIRRGYFTP